MSGAAPVEPDSPPAYRRILLVRTDRVGDLVLSTPAIASFRRSWPDAAIEALVNDYNEPVLRYNPDIDRVHVLSRSATMRESKCKARDLGRGLDLAVALAPRTPDLQLCGWSGARRRIGYVYRRRFVSRVAARWLLTDVGISDADPDLSDRFPDKPVAHEVHQVQSLVALAGGHAFTDELVLRYAADDADFARRAAPQDAVAINLAPRWFAEDFGFRAMVRLVERVAGEHEHVVIPYGVEVAEEAARLRDSVATVNVTWLADLPLLRWAAVLARCSVVIVVDSGTTHVAAALGVPVVVVYERLWYNLTSREWSPWHVPNAILRKPPPGADPAPLIEDIAASARALRFERALP